MAPPLSVCSAATTQHDYGSEIFGEYPLMPLKGNYLFPFTVAGVWARCCAGVATPYLAGLELICAVLSQKDFEYHAAQLAGADRRPFFGTVRLRLEDATPFSSPSQTRINLPRVSPASRRSKRVRSLRPAGSYRSQADRMFSKGP